MWGISSMFVAVAAIAHVSAPPGKTSMPRIAKVGAGVGTGVRVGAGLGLALAGCVTAAGLGLAAWVGIELGAG
jgi:hypothetical protein